MYATLEEAKTLPRVTEGGHVVVRTPCCPYCLSIDLDVVSSLLPSLQRTMIAIQELKEATANEVAEVTERSRSVETIYLNQLTIMGYLTKLRKGHRMYFTLRESGGSHPG